jgi:hypothetical protein
MSTNPGHINQLAAIIREVDGSHAKGAADLAEAILSHPGSMWQPPATLAQPELAGGLINDQQREAVQAAVAEALGDAYDCTRLWVAWQLGTMGPDDFVLVAEDDDRVAEIADAAIEALRPAARAQPEGESSLNVNLSIDTSPENLKRLCDGLTAAVTPNGGYEAATTDDPAPGTGGDQVVQVQWWIPQHGCDSLENTLDAIKYRIGRAVMDWWATALVPAALAQPEGDGPGLAKIDEKELLRVYCNARRAYCHEGPEHINWQRDAERGATLAGLGAVLARWALPAAPPPLPPSYIDPEHKGQDRELLQTFYRACQAEGGTADEIHLRGIRAVLAAHPAAPPAPEVWELATLFTVGASCGGGARLSQDQCALAATLLQQQQARIAREDPEGSVAADWLDGVAQ